MIIHIHMHMHIHIHIHIYIYTYTYTYIYICIHTYIYVYVYVYVYSYSYDYSYVCIYIYIYTYTYSYIYKSSLRKAAPHADCIEGCGENGAGSFSTDGGSGLPNNTNRIGSECHTSPRGRVSSQPMSATRRWPLSL